MCTEQKARFGPAASSIPYVECDPKGVGADPERCGRVGVRRYPTWIVGTGRHEGLLTLEELSRLSSFRSANSPSR